MTKHEEAVLHYKGGVHNRRVRALARLKNQLVLGTKPNLVHIERSGSEWRDIPLLEQDKLRISKEILKLTSIL